MGDVAGSNGRLAELAARIHAAQRVIWQATIATGRNLAIARRLLPDRDYRQWVAEQWGWSNEMALQLAGIADTFGETELGDAADLISPGAMLVLWPPNAAPAAAAAIALARRGQRITHGLAVELLAEHCPEVASEIE